jgi:TatA/E family protein of Tat protein translocase
MPFPNIGPGELILILIIALVVLGPGKLPDVASSLGKSVREFRKAASDVTDAGKLDTPSQAPAPSAAPAAQAQAADAPAPATASPVSGPAAVVVPPPAEPAESTTPPEPAGSSEPASEPDRS